MEQSYNCHYTVSHRNVSYSVVTNQLSHVVVLSVRYVCILLYLVVYDNC